MWLLSGIAATAVSRAISAARVPQFGAELLVALSVSFLAGLAATALDFGGWAELDWRAGVFVFCCSLTAIAAHRVVRLMLRRAGQH